GLNFERTTNQDAYGYLRLVEETDNGFSDWLVACVSDGMGGMQAGEVASEIAVSTVLQEAGKLFEKRKIVSEQEKMEVLKNWFNLANERVASALEERRAKGGCTLLCCFLQGKSLAVAHIGDCRLYLFRDNSQECLTKDHSLAAALSMQDGNYDPNALRNHPDRSLLTRTLGDRLPLPPHFVDAFTMELKDGDVLLLCSDGVWEPVSAEEMLDVLKNYPSDLDGASRKILELCLERGASDNATILLIKIKENKPIGGEGKC
ncbi:MAG: PP2C family protein-serine/threonine phosphatase, partial [bacterium]